MVDAGKGAISWTTWASYLAEVKFEEQQQPSACKADDSFLLRELPDTQVEGDLSLCLVCSTNLQLEYVCSCRFKVWLFFLRSQNTNVHLSCSRQVSFSRLYFLKTECSSQKCIVHRNPRVRVGIYFIHLLLRTFNFSFILFSVPPPLTSISLRLSRGVDT